MAVVPTQIRHYISDEDVLLAPSLAKSGEQRLYDIVDGEPQVFLFDIRLSDGRAASVEFNITPIVHDFAPHVSYTVTGSYTTSHDDVHADEVIGAAQLVYNTYIRVTWLRLNGEILKHRPRAPSLPYASSNICPDNISDGTIAHTTSYSTPLENSENDVCLSEQTVASSGDEVDSQEIIHTVNTARANEAKLDEPASEIAHKKKLDELAGNIINKIRRHYGSGDTRALDVTHAVSHCLRPQEYSQRDDDYLDQVEKELASAESNDNMIVWLNWFFYSCFRLVRDPRRSGTKHTPSRGAKLANIIVDQLLISDGRAALWVYNIFAECCYKFRKASEQSFQDIEHIGSMVVKNLRGNLRGLIHSPFPCSQVPLPMVWLSLVFRKVHPYNICYDIGLSPHLWLTHPLWLKAKPKLYLLPSNAVPVMGVTMTQFEKNSSQFLITDLDDALLPY